MVTVLPASDAGGLVAVPVELLPHPRQGEQQAGHGGQGSKPSTHLLTLQLVLS